MKTKLGVFVCRCVCVILKSRAHTQNSFTFRIIINLILAQVSGYENKVHENENENENVK